MLLEPPFPAMEYLLHTEARPHIAPLGTRGDVGSWTGQDSL